MVFTETLKPLYSLFFMYSSLDLHNYFPRLLRNSLDFLELVFLFIRSNMRAEKSEIRLSNWSKLLSSDVGFIQKVRGAHMFKGHPQKQAAMWHLTYKLVRSGSSVHCALPRLPTFVLVSFQQRLTSVNYIVHVCFWGSKKQQPSFMHIAILQQI